PIVGERLFGARGATVLDLGKIEGEAGEQTYSATTWRGSGGGDRPSGAQARSGAAPLHLAWSNRNGQEVAAEPRPSLLRESSRTQIETNALMRLPEEVDSRTSVYNGTSHNGASSAAVPSLGTTAATGPREALSSSPEFPAANLN